MSVLVEYSEASALLALVLEESSLYNPFMNREISGICISCRARRAKALFERSWLGNRHWKPQEPQLLVPWHVSQGASLLLCVHRN